MKSLNGFIVWLSLFTIILPMWIASQKAVASNAEGQLTVAGNKVQLQHAYAIVQPGYFDNNNEDIMVIVTNIPLSDKAIGKLESESSGSTSPLRCWPKINISMAP